MFMDEELLQKAMEAKSLDELLELMEAAGLGNKSARENAYFARLSDMTEKLSQEETKKAPDSRGGGVEHYWMPCAIFS